MSKIKYLYFDDPNPKQGPQEEALIALVEPLQTADLEIEPHFVKPWEEQKIFIQENVNSDTIQGVILDWKLNENSNTKTKKSANYNAEGLAQQLRAMMTQRELKSVPIILCSANEDFKSTYANDDSSHKLFDEVYEKQKFDNTTVSQLLELARGYKYLQTSWEISGLLGISQEEMEKFIDLRLISEIEDKRTLIVRELVYLLLRETIEPTGILINEDILAARLGVDKEKSTDWGKLKELLKGTNLAYSGLFSSGWDRWWAFKIENWWKEIGGKQHLKLTNAGERVDLIKSVTGLAELTPAEKLRFCSSDEFWTICVATRRPIDTIDGFLTKFHPNYDWQEQEYVSLWALLEKENGANPNMINALDKQRFLETKKKL